MSTFPKVEFAWPAGDFRLNLSDTEKAAAAVAYENLCLGVLRKAVGQRQLSRFNFGPENERLRLTLHAKGVLANGDRIYTKVIGLGSRDMFEPGTTYEILTRKTPANAAGSLDPNAQTLLYLPDLEPGAILRHDCEIGTQSHGVKDRLRAEFSEELLEARALTDGHAERLEREYTAQLLEQDLGLNDMPIDLTEVGNVERLLAQSEICLPHPDVRI